MEFVINMQATPSHAEVRICFEIQAAATDVETAKAVKVAPKKAAAAAVSATFRDFRLKRQSKAVAIELRAVAAT